MSGDDESTANDAVGDAPVRRATVTTIHADAATAERVAASLGPDNTAEMTTRTEGSRVVTTVTRESTGGLASTLDDYVVNATVAARLATDDETRHGDTGQTDTATQHSDTPTS
jgi:hypothetical protein